MQQEMAGKERQIIMKKKKRWKKVILVLLILLVLAAAAAVMLLGPGTQEAVSMMTNETTQEAYLGTIRLTTEGNGSIEAAKETPVTAEYTMKISTTVAEDGDVIEAGDVIAEIDRDSLQEQIALLESQLSEINTAISATDRSGSSTLTSPVAGRVKRIFAKEDEVLTDVVTEHGGVMEIAADGRLKVEIPAVDSLKPGETVTVAFLSYEEEGTVVSKEDGICTILIEDEANYIVDTEATVMDEDERVLGTGYLKSNHPYLIEAAYGIVDEIHVDTGDYVERGSTLLSRRSYTYNGAYLDLLDNREELTQKLQELRQLERDPVLCAQADGILSGLMLSDAMPVQEGSVMYHLISTEQFWLKVAIDELDIAGVQEGQTATVVFDAFDTEEYEGKVEKISALGQNVGGVTKYTVTVSVPGIDKVKTAMSATATIVTEEKTDALLVPVDALQMVDGERCVTVVEGETKKSVPVTLGLVNNTEAEILEGISEGDTVVVYGKSNFQIMMDMMESARTQQGGN